MANWNNPNNTSSYLDVLDVLKARDVDALSLLKDAGTNVPNGAIRFVREANNKVTIQERINNAWVDKIISIDSGGFDSGGASLGTMAGQDSDDVTITGGSVASSTLSGAISAARIPNLTASKINSGKFGVARIPNLPASRVDSGIFDTGRIPTLNASKIQSGVFGANRIPSLPASRINSGVFDSDRIPAFSSASMPSGTFIGYKLAYNDTEFSTSSTSYQATPLTISYTVQQANNKLLLTLYRLTGMGHSGGGDSTLAKFQIRDENGVVIPDAVGNTEYRGSASNSRAAIYTILHEIDNPGLGDHTYTVYVQREGDNRAIKFIKGAFIVQEIRG